MVSRTSSAALAILSMLCVPNVEAQSQSHAVAITVDDLPYASSRPGPLNPTEEKKAMQVNEKILRIFTRHHVPATGFVIEQRVEALGIPAGRKILKQWTRPGYDLGNHLYSHADVNSLSVDQIEQEITRGEATFATLLMNVDRKPEFLRFPYNHTGDTKEKHDLISGFMSAHGYRLAPCTIDSSDYEFNTAYVLAVLRHDKGTAAKIRGDYIAYTGAEINWYAALDKKVFGYEPPEVMLLHDSPLNADTSEQVLAQFQRRGYRFVSLQQATSNPAYAIPETYITKYGMMWGYRWAKELHVKVDGQNEPYSGPRN
jgi:peptidoglycan/xylan/chitin deacetylase (PgdA/CDA1 family)